MREAGAKFVQAVLFFGLFYLIADFATPRDDSDPPNGRSGFTIYKDALTGCEYIGRGFIATTFTPRMAADGRQLCRK